MIRILLLEDQHLLREGLKLVLEGDPLLRVEAEAEDGAKALQLLEHQTFDLFLLDLSLPDMDGTECLRRKPGSTPSLVVSMHESAEVVGQAMAAGAQGYVLKTATPGQLRQACHEVAAGGRHIQPGLLQGPSGNRPALQLSPAEHTLLHLHGRGHSRDQLLHALALSPASLDSRIRSICRKLGCQQLEQAYDRAIEAGMLLPNPHR